MYRVPAGAPLAFRCGIIGLLGALLLVVLSVDAAEARWRKRASSSKASAASIITEARYAHIVVDGNSGDVLSSSNADSLRHPASLTKIMTLYLLFERLESGKIRLDTPLPVSQNATQQAPTKLGTAAGQTIAVEDAIKALVTKSANDIAVVIAESLGGSEDEFARMMTRKARALGMSRTVYRNASGLPDDEQVTTARDQALLGLAIQDRFPRYYRYFSTESFVYRGRSIANHNRLLGRVEGVDGIKTGYTHASGFNLVTSVRRGQRFVVAAVFGGRTGAQRDARMRDLIEAHVMEASVRRTAPKIAEIAEAPAARPAKTRVADAAPASVPLPAPAPAAREKDVPARESAAKEPARTPEAVTTAAIAPRPSPGSTDPIKPNVVKTVSVKAGPTQAVATAPLTLLSPAPVSSQAHAALGSRGEPDLPAPPPGAKPGVLGVLPAKPAATPPAPQPAPALQAAPAPAPAFAPVQTAGAAPPAPAPFTTASVTTRAAPPAPSEMRAPPRGGWIIQVGAFEDIGEAKERLSSAKAKAAKLLEKGDPFTEPVVKGDKTLYRARFAGLNQEQAEAACKHLKRSEIACMAMRN